LCLDPLDLLVRARLNISANFTIGGYSKTGNRRCTHLHNFKVLHVFPFRFNHLPNDVVLSGLSGVFRRGGLCYEGVGKGVC
jgi:hypothetical protein